jgi:4a-hydroxytetrahydrobiopterin dehydratase
VRTPLEADELTEAFRTLPAWSGDTRRITRTVLGPPEALESLQRRVGEMADALDHHPVVEPVPGGLRFVLWTHVRDAVTEQDVALAHCIDVLAG